ncbi:TRAP transporter small permease [Zoogloeaceae bacterium G21618-S1]|nr:TRAP transporter small permease [Zoogloeaceae bacterium G21618-S1]
MDPTSEGGIVLRGARQIDRLLARLEKILLAGAVILMAVNTIANVVVRLGFSSSLFFVEELNQFLIVLVTFVGTSAAARQGRHIRMSAITDMLPLKYRRWMFAFIQSTTAIVLAALAWYAATYILRVQGLGRVTPAMQVPMWITLVWLPLGLGIAALQFVLASAANLRSKDDAYLAQYVREQDDVDMPTV